MRKVAGMSAGRKPEVRSLDAARRALAELNGRIELIQALIPLGLKAVEDELQAAVTELVGPPTRSRPTIRRRRDSSACAASWP